MLQPESRETLARILKYHVVSGELTTNELKGGQLKTLADRPLNLKINRGTNQIFDTQLMQKPEISGKEYQQGTLAEYETREYLLSI